MTASLAVLGYGRAALTELFVEASNRAPGATDNSFVRRKHHIGYLDGYLLEIGCELMVVERDYVDKDFLGDFAAYHVRSFHPYDSRCIRLHFFSAGLDEGGIRRAMVGTDNVAGVQAAYLGFCVLRPLPFTVLGRTCLKPYPQKAKVHRCYPTLYRQEVDLYGLPLWVETVGFQEQDKDVAACATSAIWSVMQCTGRRFQHRIPSPAEITNSVAAGSHFERALPNLAGLTVRQIVDALRGVGLDPALIPLEAEVEESAEGLSDEGYENELRQRRLQLKIAAKAYLSAGIPCLLLVGVARKDLVGVRRANHAVAITGYRMAGGRTQGYGEADTRFVASRMDKLFVHDDQVGPFARMCFEEDGQLATSWNGLGEGRDFRAVAHTLVLPLHHKIRIPLGVILDMVLVIDKQLETVRGQVDAVKAKFSRFVWDVRLSRLDQLRADISRSKLDDQTKIRLLTQPMPKYIWRVTAMNGDKPLLEFLFDATDLTQGRMLLKIVVHSPAAAVFAGVAIRTARPSFAASLALEKIREELGSLVTQQGVEEAFQGLRDGIPSEEAQGDEPKSDA